MTEPRRPRVMLLAMYRLDRGLWGATSRITQIRDALAELVELDVVSGTRSQRCSALARYVTSGRLSGLDGVYVETSTALPGPADLAFMGIARARQLPVVTYLRDAQQLFPEYYPVDSLKRRLSRESFLPATRAMISLSTKVAYPSRGLARAILGDDREVELLPPGARRAVAPEIDVDARRLLFVGGMRFAAHGADILLSGIELARSRGHLVELVCVSRPGEELPGLAPDWYHLERAEGTSIERLLPGILATITPRLRTPYNDLAVPIKLMEYLGYGRPIIATDTHETAAIVTGAGCGLVVPDSAEGIAEGIAEVVTASPDQLRRWALAATVAAKANSWSARARRILELLGIAADPITRVSGT
jgi:glycosyltransferase involved in cell wall biosynthesis